MPHELFFKVFWGLCVVGMLYLGLNFNQSWHADAYPPVYWIMTVVIGLIGVFTTIYWVELYQAEPSTLTSISGNPVRTFYWRYWMFGERVGVGQSIAWDDFLTITISACAGFFVGHFAGPISDGLDYLWFFWLAMGLVGYMPTWLRRNHIDRWRAHIDAKRAERQSTEPHESPVPPTDPGDRRKKVLKAPSGSTTSEGGGNVFPLRPKDGDRSEGTA